MAFATTRTIEACSLSSITAIASNPPQQPYFPAPDATPLVLYIARVPGSRDVFLTPLKPREAVVTAEDVQSSLYYVHINSDSDHEMLEQDQQPNSPISEPEQLIPVDQNVIKRKPVQLPRPLPSPTLAISDHDHMPSLRERSPSPHKSPLLARKPLSRHDKAQVSMHLDLPEIPLRVSRPLPTPPDEEPRRKSFQGENSSSSRLSEQALDANPYFRRSFDTTRGPPIDVTTSELGSLTLIRREPGTSEQWNIATIHDPPVHEISSSALLNPSSANRTKKGGAPLYLDITNTGYSQFIEKDRPVSRTSTSTRSSDSEPAPEGTFRRRLYMPGSRYGDHGYGHRKHKSIDLSSGGDMRRSMRDTTLPDATGGAGMSVDSRSKSYSFTSPWDGVCEFSTSATGKSLKCRHTVSRDSAVDVSELRFNLPTSSRSTSTSVSEKRSSYFTRHSRHRSTDSGNGTSAPDIFIGDDGRVDLSLGQEKAGGGFGGKQAKLGKLIVEPEGLKMLDLVVAANVGLWWRAYERA